MKNLLTFLTVSTTFVNTVPGRRFMDMLAKNQKTGNKAV